MKKIILYILFLSISFSFAQVDVERSIISPFGGSFSTNNEMYVSSTMGELISGTFDGEDFDVTQGFEQSGYYLVLYYQDIELDGGWNLWSTYIDPTTNEIPSIVAGDFYDDVIIMKDQNGNVFWPEFDLDAIGSLTIGQGYQIKMNNPNTLIVEGDLVPYDTEFSLNTGWGIIGYLHQEPHAIEDVMSNMPSNNLIIMKDSWGNAYWPQFGLNNIGILKPSQGYQIKLAGAWNFSYLSSDNGRYGDVYIEKPVYFSEPINTGSNMIIGLPLNTWKSTPSIGDEVAAYGADGILRGSTTFQGEHLALTIWGDDATTDKKDGLSEGEKISFRLWNSETGVEQILEVRWKEGVGAYTTDGISIAGQIMNGTELTSQIQLVKITDVLGKEVNGDKKDMILLYIYDDGSIEKKYSPK